MANRRSKSGRLLILSAALVAVRPPASGLKAQEAAPVASIDRLVPDILQRKDKDLRRRRLDQLLDRLKDPQTAPVVRRDALTALARVAEIPFDRGPFLPAVRASLADPSDQVRRAALDAMPSAGAGADDLPALEKLADDPSATVRAGVAASIYGATRGDAAAAPPVVDRLLDDPSDEVKLATLHSLWGNPVSPAAEEKVIALTRRTMSGGPGAVGYDAVYYALSTRPIVSLPVARRLIELLQDPELDPNVRWRAAWGLSHEATPEAADLAVSALIRELDETLIDQIRLYAVDGLATHRTPAATAKLRELAEADENRRVREAAARALKR